MRLAYTSRSPRPAHVYVIEEDSGWVKVGVSANPRSRLASLQTGNPRALRLAWISDLLPRQDALLYEEVAHIGFERWSVSGEWFSCGVETAIVGLLGAMAADR